MRRLLNEPVIIASVVQSGIALAIAFGANVTTEQLAAIMTFTGTVLALLARALVTPNQLAEARVAEGLSPTKPRGSDGPGPLPVIFLAVAIGMGALTMPACAGNPAPANDPTVNLSPSGKASYQATKVVKALDLLRDVAAEGEKQNPKIVSAQTALKVVGYHRQVVRTIGAVPDGWKAVALAGLDELQKSVPAAEWSKLEPFVNLLKTLYAEIVEGGSRTDTLFHGGARWVTST